MSGTAKSAGGKGFEIEILGLDQTLGVMRSVEPEILKRLRKEMRDAARIVSSDAAGSSPSGHPLAYTTEVRFVGKRPGMKVRAADRDTAIFEFAGTLGLSRDGGPITPQGAAMIRWLDTFGSPGRFLWEAWDSNKAAVIASVQAAMDAAERELQARLASAGEVF